jgi:hypothetical protein
MLVMSFKPLRSWLGRDLKNCLRRGNSSLEKAHSLGLVFAPGSAPPVVWETPESAVERKPDDQTVVRAFKAHLADYHLPDELIAAYATTFSHSGESLLKTENKRAETAIAILRSLGATRVAKHD